MPRFLKFKMYFTDLLIKTFDKKSMKQDAKKYFEKEVIRDIATLKEYKEFYENYPVIIPYEGDVLIDIRNMIKEKYLEKYCPNCEFKYFSREDKIKYLMLRIEIDKLLGITNTRFEI